jgi:chemotaxis protein MotA
MDFATIIGIIGGLALIISAIMIGGTAHIFLDVPSIMIVGGGTLASILIAFPLRDVLQAFLMARQVFAERNVDPNEVVRVIITVANLSRRQGLVALSKVRTDNAILKKAMMLIADGASEEMIEQTLRIEIEALRMRRLVAQDVFKKMGAFSPAFGMVGTLIGLVQMLLNLENPKAVGPAMAVALLTTFYGAFFAYLFFLPVAAKLKSRTQAEIVNLEIIFEGAKSILQNNNPMLIYEKLSSFIPPRQRAGYRGGGG